MSMLDTWVRYAANELRWAIGKRLPDGTITEYAHRLTSMVAALPVDSINEAVRQIVRWKMPLYDTPVDVIPYLLRAYGLPQYAARLTGTGELAPEAYFVSLQRLYEFLDSHVFSGSREGLVAELYRAGWNATADFEPGDPADSVFYISSPDVTAPREYDDGLLYDAPTIVYDGQMTIEKSHNVRRLLAYFKPARERFAGFIPV